MNASEFYELERLISDEADALRRKYPTQDYVAAIDLFELKVRRVLRTHYDPASAASLEAVSA